MSRPLSLLPLAFALALGAVACTGSPAPTDAPVRTATPKTGPITVAVSSFPAQYLVERIGGAVVKLDNVLPVGEDPPFWSPSGDVVAGVQQAELIVANGAGFEKWMETATLPADKVVDSAGPVQLIRIQGETHSHGKGGEHSHAGIDPHTWSDPLAYLQQAEVVHAALVAARPGDKATFDANLSALAKDLQDLDRALADATAPGKGMKLAANHPAFNYLARRYKLSIQSFDFDPEVPPTGVARGEFVDWADGVDKPPHLLWESAPEDAVRRAFPAGTLHVNLDPLEQPPDGADYDYLAQAHKNVVTFKTIFRKTPAAPSEGSP